MHFPLSWSSIEWLSFKFFMQVLEFQKGTLQNLYWKNFGCNACSQDSICLNNQNCAVPTSTCKSNGGSKDCSLSVQLAFSGTDKNLYALNSWYEVENLRQYSLYGLFSNIRDSVTGLIIWQAFWILCVFGYVGIATSPFQVKWKLKDQLNWSVWVICKQLLFNYDDFCQWNLPLKR